jgi:hypothetical protein
MATKAKSILVSMRAAILRAAAYETESLRCLGCGGALDLSQPDGDSPGSLVGACHGRCKHCGCCHVIDADDPAETLVVMIPSFAVLRKAIEGEHVASSGVHDGSRNGLESSGAALP